MKHALLAGCLALALSSCATLMNSDMVEVPVLTTPEQATLTVNGTHYTSPATVLVPRGHGNFLLYIEKEGYKPVNVLLRQSRDGWLWGDLVMGGPVGIAVDFITGDAYDVEPASVNVNLSEKSSSLDTSEMTRLVLLDLSSEKTSRGNAMQVTAGVP